MSVEPAIGACARARDDHRVQVGLARGIPPVGADRDRAQRQLGPRARDHRGRPHARGVPLAAPIATACSASSARAQHRLGPRARDHRRVQVGRTRGIPAGRRRSRPRAAPPGPRASSARAGPPPCPAGRRRSRPRAAPARLARAGPPRPVDHCDRRQLGPRARDHRRVQPAAHAAVRWSAPIATVAPGRPRTRHPAGRHRSRPHAAPARPARTGPPPCPGRPRTRHRAGRHRSRPRAAQARPTRGTTAASMSTRRSAPARPARAGPPPRPSRTGDRRQLGPRARTTAVSRSAAHAVSPAGRRRSRPRAAPAGPRARNHRRVQISADRDRGSASSARARGTTVGRRRSRSRAALARPPRAGPLPRPCRPGDRRTARAHGTTAVSKSSRRSARLGPRARALAGDPTHARGASASGRHRLGIR